MFRKILPIISLTLLFIMTAVASAKAYSVTADSATTVTGSTSPTGLAFDSSGNLYIGTGFYQTVKKINTSKVLSTFAGVHAFFGSYSGDGGPAISAHMKLVDGLAVDASGNVYIADPDDCRIRRLDHATGIISTIAGNGTSGFSGDEGQVFR